MCHDDFSGKYNITCTQRLFFSLLQAFPLGIVQLVKDALSYLTVIPRLINLIICNLNILEDSYINNIFFFFECTGFSFAT